MLDRDRVISSVGAWVRNCLIFDELDSTHLFARRLMEQLDEEDIPISPTLVVAESQSGGVGRGQRTWSSGPGGLYFNIVWATTEPSNISQLPILAATAFHRAVSAVGIDNAGIKWPNDILVDGRKLGGILIHARHGARLLATIGVGVNITTSPDLSGLSDSSGLQATCVAEILGPGDAEERSMTVITTFLGEFCKSLSDPKPAVEHWKSNLIHSNGDTIRLSTSSGVVVSGTFAGVNPDGHLMIKTEDGVQTLTGGDIVEADG